MSYINETSAPDLTGTESKWCRKMLTDEAARSTIFVPEEYADAICKRRRIDRQPRTTPGTYTHKNDCMHCRDFIIISCIGKRTLHGPFFLVGKRVQLIVWLMYGSDGLRIVSSVTNAICENTFFTRIQCAHNCQ